MIVLLHAREAALIGGALLLLGGLGLAAYAVGTWGAEGGLVRCRHGDDAARYPVEHRDPALKVFFKQFVALALSQLPGVLQLPLL
jgi:hypothetical protein